MFCGDNYSTIDVANICIAEANLNLIQCVSSLYLS